MPRDLTIRLGAPSEPIAVGSRQCRRGGWERSRMRRVNSRDRSRSASKAGGVARNRCATVQAITTAPRVTAGTTTIATRRARGSFGSEHRPSDTTVPGRCLLTQLGSCGGQSLPDAVKQAFCWRRKPRIPTCNERDGVFDSLAGQCPRYQAQFRDELPNVAGQHRNPKPRLRKADCRQYRPDLDGSRVRQMSRRKNAINGPPSAES